VQGNQKLTSEERIRRRAEFQQVFEGGARISGRFMTLIVARNKLPVSRLGIVASRRLGVAVRRGRLKRLTRELFRRNKVDPGFDIVVMPRREMLEAPYASLERDYRILLQKRVRAR
jgi:ribonuclease P protein component